MGPPASRDLAYTYVASLTTLTWEHVRTAGTFRDAVTRFDAFVQERLKGKEFAFVTLDSWDLRVQVPREARDKAVVLSPYLQHTRTFDLRSEYQRWQQHHPESLPFGSSSLANICAALEVEPVQSSAPIKHNLPFHLQALAPASPRRAIEEAITLARVLRGLIQKSKPPHEHPDVLTRPLDAYADVRAFLEERSKVLHMSGLPHDTTQSELESWFTQFGGRPIAFWTVRTPDQHKPTGSGFAVFSSHEEVSQPPNLHYLIWRTPLCSAFHLIIPFSSDFLPVPFPCSRLPSFEFLFTQLTDLSQAAESLCMNGRALNEKAIEVSPSSSRVLDRAAECLMPFPPSKNRPRPGDWTCPSCGFSNFQRRTACFRCSYPAASAAVPGADPMSFSNYGYGPPHMIPPHQMGHQGGHGMGHGRGGGGMVPFRAGDWKCGSEGCGYHNFAKNVTCLRCGASRAGAAVVADSAFPSPHESSSGFGMTPTSITGTPAPAPFAAPTGFPSAGFGGQQYGGPPPSQYALPSGIGAPSNPYPPIGAGYGQGLSSGPFDSRTSEAAFSSGPNGPPSSGAAPSTYGGQSYGIGTGSAVDGSTADPFAFLSSGLGALSVNDENRRNGANPTKSPA